MHYFYKKPHITVCRILVFPHNEFCVYHYARFHILNNTRWIGVTCDVLVIQCLGVRQIVTVHQRLEI
jgi:hypothetical protein